MWRGFVLLLAWAAFSSPAAAQDAPNADTYPSGLRLQPLWTQSLRTRVLGLDVTSAGPEASGFNLGFDRRFGSWLMGLKGDWFSGQGCARVDPFSANYLRGSIVDFSDALTGGGFKISNPNARQSCGCGKSFEA